MNTMTSGGRREPGRRRPLVTKPDHERGRRDLLASSSQARRTELPEVPAAEVDPRFAARLDDVGRSSAAARAGALHWRSPRLPSPHSSAWSPCQFCSRHAASTWRARCTSAPTRCSRPRACTAAVDAAARHRCGRPARRTPAMGRRRGGVDQLAEHAGDPRDRAGARRRHRRPRPLGAARVERAGGPQGAGRPTADIQVVGPTTARAGGHTIVGGSAVDVINRLPDDLRRQVVGLDLSGGGVTLRLAGDLALRFGDMSAVPSKSGAALVVLGVPHAGCHYIDVSVPSAPVCG